MTVREIITQAKNLLSDGIEQSVLLTWFNEIELMVQMQLYGASRADAVQYTEQTMDAQPIVQGHYERVYSYWLLAKGHARLKNESGYDRYRKLYISEYAAYRKWMIRTHGVSDLKTDHNGVYMTAYGIAQKYGFAGTEAEWLASLHGRDGADGHNGRDGKDGKDGAMGAQGPRGEKGEKGDKGEPGYQGPAGPQGEPGRDGADGKDGKDGTSLQYDLPYDPATHVLCLLCNGAVVRSFDLTQELDELLGILDAEGANLLDCEGAVILPL